jgi:hypothetical protein
MNSPEGRTVQIPGSEQHAGQHLITITLAWVCPVCGQPRGPVFRTISYDGSRRLGCDGWTTTADTSTATPPSGQKRHEQ